MIRHLRVYPPKKEYIQLSRILDWSSKFIFIEDFGVPGPCSITCKHLHRHHNPSASRNESPWLHRSLCLAHLDSIRDSIVCLPRLPSWWPLGKEPVRFLYLAAREARQWYCKSNNLSNPSLHFIRPGIQEYWVMLPSVWTNGRNSRRIQTNFRLCFGLSLLPDVVPLNMWLD